MAGSQGDLLQITDYQSYYEQQVLNIYYYRIVSALGMNAGQYAAMLDWFRDNLISDVRQVQNGRLAHVSLELRNLTNNTDIVTLTHNLVGLEAAGASEDQPSYVTIGFKLVRENLVTRNGYKRFSGLCDGRIVGNTYTFASSAIRTNIEAELAADYVVATVPIAEPIIVKRPIIPPVAVGYEYSSIGSAIYTQLGTQNTRKQGRGT